MSKPVHSLHSIPGPEVIQKKQLSNGISVLCLENPNSAAVNIIGLIKASSKNDPVDKLGLADFTASMLTRGTQNKTFQQIHDLLESCGASLSFSASIHNTWFAGKSLAEDLPMLLEISADCLIHPVFPGEYFERMRSQILSELAIRDQDTADQASLALDKILFPNHPMGNPTDGYPETIQSIQLEDLVRFHHSHFGTDGMILVIVGGIQPESTFNLVNRYFENWKAATEKTQPLPEVAPLKKSIRKHIEISEKNQMDILIGCHGPARKSPDYLPAFLGNDILGQFGMLGRIGESVRIKSGLAYYAGSSLNSWQEGGDWEFMAGVNPIQTDKAIELIKKEIKKFTNQEVTREELSDSKSHLSGRLALSLESNAGLANAILNMEHFQLGLDYFQRYATLVNSISADQILDAARRHLNSDRLAVVSAGSSPKT
jgi:zinc protease